LTEKISCIDKVINVIFFELYSITKSAHMQDAFLTRSLFSMMCLSLYMMSFLRIIWRSTYASYRR